MEKEGFVGLHVGAGSHSARLQVKYKQICRRACRLGIELLRSGVSALETCASVTALLEDSPLTNAGLGSSLNWDGRVECDASVMDGESLLWGGVGAVPGVKNPVQVARALCERQKEGLALGRIPPSLLVGPGARKWAKRAGIETVPREKLISVGVVCLDQSGNIASACSSGGIPLKHAGRVGQAGSYGSGTWAQNAKDGAAAVAVCTSGCGEHLMRTMLAKEVAVKIQGAVCPTSALDECMKTAFMASPFLADVSETLAGVAALRVDESGLGEFLWGHTTPTMCLGYMSTVDSAPQTRVSALGPGATPGKALVIEGTSFKQCSTHLGSDREEEI